MVAGRWRAARGRRRVPRCGRLDCRGQERREHVLHRRRAALLRLRRWKDRGALLRPRSEGARGRRPARGRRGRPRRRDSPARAAPLRGASRGASRPRRAAPSTPASPTVCALATTSRFGARQSTSSPAPAPIPPPTPPPPPRLRARLALDVAPAAPPPSAVSGRRRGFPFPVRERRPLPHGFTRGDLDGGFLFARLRRRLVRRRRIPPATAGAFASWRAGPCGPRGRVVQ